MKYLRNSALILTTSAIIAFTIYVTKDPETYHPLTDTLVVMPHSEINEYEVYGEMMIEQQINKHYHE